MSASPAITTGSGELKPVKLATTVWVEAAPVVTKLLSWSRIRITGWVPKTSPALAVVAEVAIATLVAAPWVRSITWVILARPLEE